MSRKRRTKQQTNRPATASATVTTTRAGVESESVFTWQPAAAAGVETNYGLNHSWVGGAGLGSWDSTGFLGAPGSSVVSVNFPLGPSVPTVAVAATTAPPARAEPTDAEPALPVEAAAEEGASLIVGDTLPPDGIPVLAPVDEEEDLLFNHQPVHCPLVAGMTYPNALEACDWIERLLHPRSPYRPGHDRFEVQTLSREILDREPEPHEEIGLLTGDGKFVARVGAERKGFSLLPWKWGRWNLFSETVTGAVTRRSYFRPPQLVVSIRRADRAVWIRGVGRFYPVSITVHVLPEGVSTLREYIELHREEAEPSEEAA